MRQLQEIENDIKEIFNQIRALNEKQKVGKHAFIPFRS